MSSATVTEAQPTTPKGCHDPDEHFRALQDGTKHSCVKKKKVRKPVPPPTPAVKCGIVALLALAAWCYVSPIVTPPDFTWEKGQALTASLKVPLGIVAGLYCPAIYFLQKLMTNRPAFELRGVLTLWNLTMALFSIVGTIKLIPAIIHNVLQHSSPYSQMCDPSVYWSASAPWLLWFGYSKVVEFVDTVLLALRKKDIIFLHWFHHIATMLYCWYALQHVNGATGIWFTEMNLIVHSLMYFYYFLTTLGYRPWWGRYLTMIQLGQMGLGLTVIYFDLGCEDKDPLNLAWAAAMYFVYAVLFAKLYVDKWVKPKRKKGEKSD